MFRGTPEQSLWLVKQRQAQLIHEAEQYRLAMTIHGDPADNLSIRRFNWTWRWLARLSASVRTLSGGGAPCNDPCPDCAPC
jgi:hypothetical protein